MDWGARGAITTIEGRDVNQIKEVKS